MFLTPPYMKHSSLMQCYSKVVVITCNNTIKNLKWNKNKTETFYKSLVKQILNNEN